MVRGRASVVVTPKALQKLDWSDRVKMVLWTGTRLSSLEDMSVERMARLGSAPYCLM